MSQDLTFLHALVSFLHAESGYGAESNISALSRAELIAELIAEPFPKPAYLYCSIAVLIPLHNACRTLAEP